MCQEKDNSLSFTIGILAGIVGGIIAGVLYAPKPGEESRKKIVETIDNVREKVSPEIKEAKTQAVAMIEKSKYKLERKYRKMADAYKAEKLARAKNKESDIYSL